MTLAAGAMGAPGEGRPRVDSRGAIKRVAAARLISDAGSSATGIALAGALYERTGSVVWVSAGLLVALLTPAVVSPLSGAIGDRWDRLRVMVASDLLGAACCAALVVVRAPAALLVVGFAAALATAPFSAASAAVVPELVEDRDLPWANARVAAAASVGELIGPLAAGALIATVGAHAVFAVDAVTYTASAALIGSVARRRGASARAERVGGLRTGFRLLFGDPLLRGPAIAFVLVDLGSGLTLPAPIVLSTDLGGGSAGYGVLVGAIGAGTIVGTFAARRLLTRRSEIAVLVASAAGLGFAYALCAVAPALGLAALAFALAGVMLSATGIAEHVLIQRRVARDALGRVFAAHFAVIRLSTAAPVLVAGVLIAHAGPRLVLGLAAALCVAGAVVLVLVVRGMTAGGASSPLGSPQEEPLR